MVNPKYVIEDICAIRHKRVDEKLDEINAIIVSIRDNHLVHLDNKIEEKSKQTSICIGTIKKDVDALKSRVAWIGGLATGAIFVIELIFKLV